MMTHKVIDKVIEERVPVLLFANSDGTVNVVQWNGLGGREL